MLRVGFFQPLLVDLLRTTLRGRWLRPNGTTLDGEVAGVAPVQSVNLGSMPNV